jgi:exonuclease III
MTRNTKYISILTLNANGLNSSIKRHIMANCIKKQDLIICCLQEPHLTAKEEHWLKVKWTPKTGKNSYTYI